MSNAAECMCYGTIVYFAGRLGPLLIRTVLMH